MVNKFKNMGCPVELKESHMYNSSFVSAKYLKENHPDIKKYFTIGKKSVGEELKAAGIKSIGGPMPELFEVLGIFCQLNNRFKKFDQIVI